VIDQKIRKQDDQKMRPTAILLACALGLLFAASVNAQENAAGKKHVVPHGNLHFEFTHSMRIPNYHVTVDFYYQPWKTGDTVVVRSISEPRSAQGWEKTARDTTFFILKDEYKRLLEAVNLIEPPKAQADDFLFGHDGYTCVIEYGDFLNSVAIKVWVPSSKNGPTGYYEACKLLLKAGGFNPNKIF
jgi:hypothetical protein